MLPPIFKRFIELLDAFPEIGPRQAWRLFFWLLRQDRKFLNTFSETLRVIAEQTQPCARCNFPAIATGKPALRSSKSEGGAETLCELCADAKRDHSTLCIVARETDLVTLEGTKKFKGTYFVLGGLLVPYEAEKELVRERLQKLTQRLEANDEIKTVLVALPFTREAEPTLQEVDRILIKLPRLKVVRPRKGIPLGGEIEFLDPETLTEALFKEN